MAQVAIVGAGILGLACAVELAGRGHGVTVLEKEPAVATHQTGRNSNVAHAGLYYPPGSRKARLSVAGNRSIVAFSRRHGLPVQVCGKLVVATSDAELPRLAALAERAAANGVEARLIGAAEARELEPAVAAVAALQVASTAQVDYPAICAELVRQLAARGGELRCGAPVVGLRCGPDRVELDTPRETLRADALVNCAGLHADRVARLAGVDPGIQILPFRGEYCELRPPAAHLVRGLIYPVPDPRLPFLGVHLTRGLDGHVHAGPNAVLALRREGYRWRDVSRRDLGEALRYPGLRRLLARYPRAAAAEVLRSVSRRRFAAGVARLVPAITRADLVRSGAGVRAQAVYPDGRLADDFIITAQPRQVHLLNAPSPAATCALEIAREVSGRLAAVLDTD